MRLRRHGFRLLVAALGLAAPTAGAAPTGSPIGLWLVPDGDGVIEIDPCGGGLCGKIVGVTPANNQPPGQVLAKDGRPLCQRTILQAPNQASAGVWSGIIVNPNDDSQWNCEFWAEEDGLHLRGYVVLPLLGQTQLWKRLVGHVGPDCRILG